MNSFYHYLLFWPIITIGYKYGQILLFITKIRKSKKKRGQDPSNVTVNTQRIKDWKSVFSFPDLVKGGLGKKQTK